MRIRKMMWAAAVVLCTAMLLLSVAKILIITNDYRQAGNEYAALRQLGATGAGSQETQAADAPSPAAELGSLNPDYIGWVQIPGTAVDYPVVRGQDNKKYLGTTFNGEKNPAGAIFMDCGAAAAFDARHTILYGHNMRDGSMFGGLQRYLEQDYLEQHSTLLVTTAEGVPLTYTIFSARKTDMQDDAYRTDFQDAEEFSKFALGLGAPEGAEHLLTLSTCASGASAEERVVVHAARGQWPPSPMTNPPQAEREDIKI